MELINPSFIIEDDRFDVSEISDKELILEFQRSKFVFIVKCIKSQEIQWLEEYSLGMNFEALKTLFHQHSFIKANFWSHLKVVYHPLHKAIVPASYFKSNKAQDLLTDFISSHEEPVFTDFKISPSFHLVYLLENDLLSFLSDIYGEKKLNIVAMDQCLVKIPNCWVMHFEKNNITLQLLEKGYILQSRILNFETFQDFKQLISFLDLDSKQTIVLTGEITTYSKYFRHLDSIFDHVSFGKPLGNIRLSQYFSEVPTHKYVTVLNGSIVA